MSARRMMNLAVVLLSVFLMGAPANAQTAADFTVIMLPDTQFYSATAPQVFAAQTRWVVDNKLARNIKLVVGVGDIVNGGGEFVEWNNANAAVTMLDGNVPYMLAIGNHDYNAN